RCVKTPRVASGARGSAVAEPRLERADARERGFDDLGVESPAQEPRPNLGEDRLSGGATVGQPVVGDEQDVRARRQRSDGSGLEPTVTLDRAHPEIVRHDRPTEAELVAEEPRD